MTSPLVSIIVPNFNHADFLDERMRSVFSQSYQNIEVIILDDASTDGSFNVLKKYQGHPLVVHFDVNEVNSGSTFKQWFKGIERARGKYLWIAESDDWCDLNFLHEMVELLESNLDCCLAFCDSIEIDHDGRTYNTLGAFDIARGKFGKYSGEQFVNQYMVEKNAIPNVSAVLFRSSVIKTLPPEVLSFKYVGDWYAYVNLFSKGDVVYLNKPLNYFRFHSNTTRSTRSEDSWCRVFEEVLRVLNSIRYEFSIPDKRYLDEVRNNIDCISIYRNFPTYISSALTNEIGEICIYGGGSLGSYCYHQIATLCPKVNVAFFIDRKAEYECYKLDGITVQTLEKSIEGYLPDIFIASIAFYDEIYEDLLERKLSHKIINTRKTI